MEWMVAALTGLGIIITAIWWRRDIPSPEVRELECGAVEVILASMRSEPEEWTVLPFRVVNKKRGISVWRKTKADLAYGEGEAVTTYEGTPVPAGYRDEMWDAIVTLNTRQITRRFRDGR